MGPRQQAWVSWSAGYFLSANMGDLIVILRMLAVLFYRYTNSDLRNLTNQRHKHKSGQWKTTNFNYTVILGATLHKEEIENEW